MKNIEIERTPEIPNLSNQEWMLLQKITTFTPEVEVKAPFGIFVFGGSYIDLKLVEQVYKEYKAPVLLVGGKVGVINENITEENKAPLSLKTKAELEKKTDIPKKHLTVLDVNSRNTLEDTLPLAGINEFTLSKGNTSVITEIVVIVKSFHAGRAFLTLAKQLPNVRIKMYTYNLDLNGNQLEPDTNSDLWKSVLWGEFKRIITYQTPKQENQDPDIENIEKGMDLSSEERHTLGNLIKLT